MTEPLVAERYRLIRRIGIGGMGHVWLARDEVLRRSVAVKEVYLPEGLSDDEINELHLRTLREARAAARLSHPSVIRIYDVLQAGDRPWIVMEYVPSRSLAQVIMEDGPLPPDRVATIGLALLGALAAAHEAGVLHRDVKPGNVLLAEDGRIVLTDFGLAVFDDLGMQVTRAGVVHGSPQFIAPERAKDGTSTAATDFWSLGATLYAAVEGRSPYARASSYATLAALATEPPDAPERAGDLKPLLAGLLRRNPRTRISPAEAERLLRAVASANGLIPRQLVHHSSDDAPADSADPTAPPRPTTPDGLPIRNRRKYADESDRRSASAVPVSPALVPRESELDTDRRMAQAWALATPGPLPMVRPATETYGRPRTRRRRLALVVSAVLVAAAAGLGGYALTGDGHTHHQSGGASAPPSITGGPPEPEGATVAQWPCTPPDPRATVDVPTSKPLTKSGLLPGWVWYADTDAGYQLAVQGRMQLLTGPDVACFYDSATTRVAGVLHTQGTEHDPAKLLQTELNHLHDGRGIPEFKLVSPVAPVLGVPGSAEVQFTYQGPHEFTMHAAMRDFVDKSGNAYTVIWQATDLDWSTGESSNYQFFWLNFNRLGSPPGA